MKCWRTSWAPKNKKQRHVYRVHSDLSFNNTPRVTVINGETITRVCVRTRTETQAQNNKRSHQHLCNPSAPGKNSLAGHAVENVNAQQTACVLSLSVCVSLTFSICLVKPSQMKYVFHCVCVCGGGVVIVVFARGTLVFEACLSAKQDVCCYLVPMIHWPASRLCPLPVNPLWSSTDRSWNDSLLRAPSSRSVTCQRVLWKDRATSASLLLHRHRPTGRWRFQPTTTPTSHWFQYNYLPLPSCTWLGASVARLPPIVC